MKKRIVFLALTLALLLVLFPTFASADDSGSCGDYLSRYFEESSGTLTFTGIVTYRDELEVYLQNENEAMLILLDDSNTWANMNAVKVGKLVAVKGQRMVLNQGGYHVPEIMDAMITAVETTQDTATVTAATLAGLNDGLMARLVKVEATKAELTQAGIQLNLGAYADAEPLSVVGVLSTNEDGRILLGAAVTAKHLAADPVRENETEATCTEPGGYDLVVYCSVCHTELSRNKVDVTALGHEPADPVQENIVPATAQQEGSYDEVVCCERCETELSREQKIIPILPMDPPVFTAQPKSVTVKSGAKATFTVKATGKEIVYRWYRCASEGEDWELIPDATKNTYSVVGARENKDWRYRCGASNAGGETFSNEAVLHVTLQSPVIQTQPKSVAIKSGAKATFTVKASGKNLTYQWLSRPSAIDPWTEVEQANKASYSVVGCLAITGTQYKCLVANGDGETETIPVTLAVTPQTIVFSAQPKDAKVKAGAKAKFTVKAKGAGLTYQWLRDGQEIAGETKAEYTFTAKMADNGHTFSCRVMDIDGQVDTSNAAALTVTEVKLAIATQPKDAKVKAGAKAKFTVKAKGAGLTYQWLRDGDEIEGATKAEYTFAVRKADDGARFSCRVTDIDGETVTSNAATLTVTEVKFEIKTQPKDIKVALGGKAKFTVKATGANLKYKWQYRTSGEGAWIVIDGATAASYTTGKVTADMGGWQFRCLVWDDNMEDWAPSNPAALTLK